MYGSTETAPGAAQSRRLLDDSLAVSASLVFFVSLEPYFLEPLALCTLSVLLCPRLAHLTGLLEVRWKTSLVLLTNCRLALSVSAEL